VWPNTKAADCVELFSLTCYSILARWAVNFCRARLNHRAHSSIPPPNLEMIFIALISNMNTHTSTSNTKKPSLSCVPIVCYTLVQHSHNNLQTINNLQASLNHRANACSCLIVSVLVRFVSAKEP
jgi:hypothetical protein